MAQAICWRLLKAEACVRSKTTLCGICDRERRIGTDISRGTSVSPSQYHSTEAQFFFITDAINLSKPRALLHTH
jgi:hypothetical protein